MAINRFLKYGYMPFDFRLYLSALFRHCWVAIIIFIFLPFSEPTGDWGPAFLSFMEAKIGFLKINSI